MSFLPRILRAIFPTCPRENARKIFGRPKKFLGTASRLCPGTDPRVGSRSCCPRHRGQLRGNLRQHFPTPVIGKCCRKFPVGRKSSWRHLPGAQSGPASLVTWALAIGRFPWASYGCDPTCRLMATYPWADFWRPRWSLGRWLPDGFRGRAAAGTPLVV